MLVGVGREGVSSLVVRAPSTSWTLILSSILVIFLGIESVPLIERQYSFTGDRFFDCYSREVSSNGDQAEHMWRDELRACSFDVSHDLYYADAEIRLGRLIYYRAVEDESPFPAEIERVRLCTVALLERRTREASHENTTSSNDSSSGAEGSADCVST